MLKKKLVFELGGSLVFALIGIVIYIFSIINITDLSYWTLIFQLVFFPITYLIVVGCYYGIIVEGKRKLIFGLAQIICMFILGAIFSKQITPELFEKIQSADNIQVSEYSELTISSLLQTLVIYIAMCGIGLVLGGIIKKIIRRKNLSSEKSNDA